MTKLLEQAITKAQALTPEMQDDIARLVLTFVGDDPDPAYGLTPEEEADLAASEAASARGEFATDDQVRAIWAKHGL